MPKPRNVLFVIIDQLRADCLTGGLADHVNLPNFRELMDDGLTFTRHYSVTNPCGPARASILTGLYAMNHRSVRNGTPLAANITNVAREARKAGYDPMLFGYTDTSLDPRQRHPSDPDLASEEGTLPEFNQKVEMRYMESFPWRADLKRKGYDLPDYSKFYVPVAAQPGQPPALDDPAFYSAEDSDTAFLTNALLAELHVRPDRNWFAHITYIRPHPPFVAPAPYNRMYNPSALPLPQRKASKQLEADTHPFCAAILEKIKLRKYVRGFEDRLDNETDEDVQTMRAIYLGLASEVDTHLGRIIAQLKETGQYDNTLIVVTSDHGDLLGDHFMWGKESVYEAAWHIPLIIRDPDRPAQHGQQVDHFTETIDITPTILDWVGAPVPVAMNGRSLRPFLAGEPPTDWRQHVFMELDLGDPEGTSAPQEILKLNLREANLSIIRDDNYKLVHFNGGYAPLLFDMKTDPGETLNLADDPAHAGALLKMTQKMLDHRMRHSDHTLTDMKATSRGTVNYNIEPLRQAQL